MPWTLRERSTNGYPYLTGLPPGVPVLTDVFLGARVDVGVGTLFGLSTTRPRIWT